MKYTELNVNWDADPNAPEERIFINGDTVLIEFYLNYFIYTQFNEGDWGRLIFTGCHKYSTHGTNDEGYYMGQHRYKYTELPWGGFYELDTDWTIDFAPKAIILSPIDSHKPLNHYIFFFKDNSFECVAADFEIEFIRAEK
ncbi:hypothetical protein FPZ42_01210 [Mucilaginibacter achroorhodeus]|uniref:Uncharacterized protein n=1 Tax=Mucilaginibacter achroorhodeus TaxID=2599294 RepID=A0A563U946_9SPHI|nr:hypothetical protein [Mucilaginibacter achroorhodeus]TWR27860.1 hypothetical protein FPZ42_01210 [Mucilaginibacter achroorhodeus]